MTPTTSTIDSGVRERYPDYFAPHRDDGVFFNPWNDEQQRGFTDILKWKVANSNPWAAEKKTETPVEPDTTGLDTFRASDAKLKTLWLGHASFLIEIDGWRCLIDPVYGRVGAFVPRFGPEPYPLSDLPSVDAVFLSHGHYDHLDVQTLAAVAELNPEAPFITPLGQSRYLPKQVSEAVELDWWQSLDFNGVRADFVPAQHWHRRGAFDTNRALWGGWVLEGSRTAYHAGDSGYCEIFRALGDLYHINVACLPVGAYEPRWFMKTQHMNPEEAIQAFLDLRAERFVGMHWGTYDLTDEPRNQGGDRALSLAKDAGVQDGVYMPRPGGFVSDFL